MVEWLESFQRNADKVLGSSKLQFTATLWRMNEPAGVLNDGKVVMCTDCSFPYLDVALSWSLNGKLRFSVFCKPNQQLKYLNLGSTHSPATFKAIPHRVALRLAQLTSVNRCN